MAVSNSFNFSLTRNDIINEAFRLTGILDQESTPTATEYTNAAQSLNIIMKRLMSRGVKLWTYEEIILIPQLNKSKYTIGISGDRCCLKSDFVQTTLASDVSAGDTVVTLTDASAIASSDIIGFYIPSGKYFGWKTVVSVSGNDVTVDDDFNNNLDAGTVVFSYTSRIAKPLKISDGMLQVGTNSQTAMTKLSQSEYVNVAQANTSSNPTQFFYKPKIDTGELFIYPMVDDEQKYLNFIIEKPHDDFDASSDTAPTPNEYYDVIIYSLAERLAFQYGFTEKSALLKARLDEIISQNELFDFSDVPIKTVLRQPILGRR